LFKMFDNDVVYDFSVCIWIAMMNMI